MATIELDIIKQRCDKLPAAEKLDLINYLDASLAQEKTRKSSKSRKHTGSKSHEKPTDSDLKKP